MRKSLVNALGMAAPSRIAPAAAPARGPASAAAPTAPIDFGLDASGDADVSRVEVQHVDEMRFRLDADPEHVLRTARAHFDASITEDQLREALVKARMLLTQEGVAEGFLEGARRFAASVGMPGDFGFEGYDPDVIPIAPMAETFETAGDWAAYAFAWIAAQTSNALVDKPLFRKHSDHASQFIYELPATHTRVGLLSDFGNGLAHSRYIAKHLAALKPAHLLYLGDVYYAGTSSEFSQYVGVPLEPILPDTNVMMLNSNHEMFSKGIPYFGYIDYRLGRGAPQRQQGSYYCLRFGDAFQVIGLDTDYHSASRLNDEHQRAWLGDVLRHGQVNKMTNILCTANEPYTYGESKTTRLLDDLAPYLGAVHLWFWGNTHYCGFFDMTQNMPLASCIGHGGYPYKLSEYSLDKDLYLAPCPATPLFLEGQRRYRGTDLRPEMGNNGFVMMELDPGTDPASRRVKLEYIDWMKNLRYRAELGPQGGKRLAVLQGEELP